MEGASFGTCHGRVMPLSRVRARRSVLRENLHHLLPVFRCTDTTLPLVQCLLHLVKDFDQQVPCGPKGARSGREPVRTKPRLQAPCPRVLPTPARARRRRTQPARPRFVLPFLRRAGEQVTGVELSVVDRTGSFGERFSFRLVSDVQVSQPPEACPLLAAK